MAPGAQVASRGALTIDAPGGGSLSDDTLAGSGAQWSIGAAELAFEAQGPVPSGFALDAGLLNVLQNAGTIRFASVNPMNFAEAVNIGGTPGAQSSRKSISRRRDSSTRRKVPPPSRPASSP